MILGILPYKDTFANSVRGGTTKPAEFFSLRYYRISERTPVDGSRPYEEGTGNPILKVCIVSFFCNVYVLFSEAQWLLSRFFLGYVTQLYPSRVSCAIKKVVEFEQYRSAPNARGKLLADFVPVNLKSFLRVEVGS